MRASQPVATGFATRDGVRIAYEVHGNGNRTILFMPAWSILHSRMWKAQVAYFARHARVVTFDGRGNGRSDRSPDLDYSDDAYAADALAVLDATDTARAIVVAFSAGVRWALLVAANDPDRVERLICISPAVPLGPEHHPREAVIAQFDEHFDEHSGWKKYNRAYLHAHYQDFVEFFFSETLPEPHSTKQFEDCVGWALETTPATLAASATAPRLSQAQTEELARRVRCPVLVLHGNLDRISPLSSGRALAELTRGTLVEIDGTGHLPHARFPVAINLAIRQELGETPARSRRRRRKKRALFISSPIGLGHAQRDAAIAAELRTLLPDITIDWLAQHPVTRVLEQHGERVHPASVALVNESAHIEGECGEHDLHAFQAIRNMDEILVNNFMVLHDVITDEHYDVVVGDEAWDVDHYLHEHPREKKTQFAWLTDFVGWIPMPDGGEYEARITSDYNAEMIGHIDRHPNVRDRAIFVGSPEDIVPERFGADLPPIREWTQAHYDFAGYVTGFVPPTESERMEMRSAFGYRSDELICIVSVGGSGVGVPLLRAAIAAYPDVQRRLPNLRMIVVAGPRIDPDTLPAHPGVDVRAFVPQLHRHLSACDIALVQGGLTTTMELAASRRPFLYFPLRHHFEQNFHVRHRLQRYNAGRCMQFAEATPETIATAIETELQRPLSYRAVETNGAATAAKLIGELF